MRQKTKTDDSMIISFCCSVFFSLEKQRIERKTHIPEKQVR